MTDEQKIAIKREQNDTCISYAEREQFRAERKQQARDRMGQRIMTLRKNADMSQEQLAQAAGLQRTHISRIEAGKYAVTLDVLNAIAEALHMTVDIVDPGLQGLAPLRKLVHN